MNWVPPLDMSCRGSSVLDRVGAALGEQGYANMPCKAVTAVLGGIGRRLKTAFAPIGVCRRAVGKPLGVGFQDGRRSAEPRGRGKELTQGHQALTPHPGWGSL